MNKLIAIGWMGCLRCYLNITVDEAIKRYCASEGIDPNKINEEGIKVKVIEFKDEFGAYSVYE